MDQNVSGRIFLALDTSQISRAISLVKTLADYIGGIKLGKEFFSANGPEGVRIISNFGLPIFLDLKFFDIPNTVLGAVRAVYPLKPAMISIHASGGREMMRVATEFVKNSERPAPMLIGITVLTSFEQCDLNEVGIGSTASDQVVRLATLAQESGMDGVVCSPHEVEKLRKICGEEFKLVVPGVRPTWSESNDQKRMATPRDAIDFGADYLVIGRPITSASDPREAAARIIDDF